MLKGWLKKLKGEQEEPEAKEQGLYEQGAVSEQQELAPEQPSSEQIQEKQAERDECEPQTEKSPRGFGLFKRLKERMEKSRTGFIRQMDQLLLGRRTIDQELLDELEEILVMADMGVSTVQQIFDQLRNEVSRKELQDPAALRKRLKELILERLGQEATPLSFDKKPLVILVVGVNGVGKTTTIAKLAYSLKSQGKQVLLVAADTFRAAAIEQLETWGQRIQVPVIKHKMGSDPSAVAFDGMEAAIKRGSDVVIVDTAGRLHTKVNLMEELKKIKRVIGKKIPGAPHEVLLVLDATTGQNAVSQARLFHEATGVTGIALTKLDGTAKGAIVISIASEMGIPIRYIGIGEGMEDLRPFDPREFVEAIFARD